MLPGIAVKVLAVAMLVACSPPAARTVYIRTVLEPQRCTLPPLPEPAVLVGFPWTGLDLMLSKSDGIELRREIDGLRAWARAVAECLER